ncbi:MAG: Xyloglucanase Xgh74A [Anaerolineales bacterium]|nr:Xyloglucanase Xgh74A [Anaerolineales bacterium]
MFPRLARWFVLASVLFVLLTIARTSHAPHPVAGTPFRWSPRPPDAPRTLPERVAPLACQNCPAALALHEGENELEATKADGKESGEGGALKRAGWFVQQRAYPGTEIPAGALQRAYVEVQRHAASRALQSVTETWVPLGPAPIRNGQPAYCQSNRMNVSGRVTALALAPNDPNTVYLGSANGGVWRSTNGGQGWTALMRDEASLSIGALVIDPTNPNVIYAGTGEGKLNNYWGAGVLKSTNGGASWTLLGEEVFDNRGIMRLAIDPTNPNALYAVTMPGGNYRSSDIARGAATGLYRTTNGGASWTQLTNGNNGLPNAAFGYDVILVPGSPSTVYVALGFWVDNVPTTHIFKSTAGGTSWTSVAQWSNPVGYMPPRVVLSISPARPNRIFSGWGPIIDEQGQVGSGVFMSEDGGQNWAALNAGGYCGEQCSYDSVVVADPTNADVLYAGGIHLFKSTDGGQNWSQISCNPTSSIHADQHALLVDPTHPNIVYSGNDGGVFKSTDGGNSWTSMNTGLELTQFIGIALHPTDPNIILGGTQDNGTNLFKGQAVWDHVQDGDGGFTAIDPAHPNTMYAQYYNLSGQQIGPTRSDTGGGLDTFKFLGTFKSQNQIVEDHGFDLNDRVLFYAPIALDPSNSAILYYGTHRLYKSTNRGEQWTAITDDLSNGRGAISTIAIAPSNPRTIYAGASDGNIAVTTDGSTFQSAASSIPNRFVSRIVVHPSNPSTAWAALSGFDETTPGAPGHVFKTIDGGSSWTNASAGLPNLPVNALTLDPANPDNLYAATDLGVYRSTDGGANWSRYSAGLPNVVVYDLAFNANTRRLVAGTFGRGIWQVNLKATGPTRTPTPTPTATSTTEGPSPTPTATPTSTVERPSPTPTSTSERPSPTPTVTQTLEPVCDEYIENGSFETGSAAPWVGGSSVGGTLIFHRDTMPIDPRTGDYAAWFGGYHDAEDELYQTISTPSSAASTTLTYWWYMETQETSGPYDFFEVQIRHANGELLEILDRINDRSQSNSWVSSSFDLGAYAGQTIQVAFYAHTDESMTTSFYVDDVSLTVCSAQTPPTPSATRTPSPTSTLSATPTPSPTATLGVTPSPSPTSTTPPGAARVYVSPPNASVGAGSTTQVAVRVDTVTDLYGYEIHLSFDPAKVQVEGTPQPGDIFAGKTVQTFQTAVDNTAGTVDYAVALQGAAGGVTRSGSLVGLTFRGTTQGSSPLTLGPTTSLSDSLAELIPAALQSGNLTVSGGGGRVLGRVQLQGRTDFSGVAVSVDGVSTNANSAGDFALSGVSGQVDVEARMPGYLFARRENVSVSDGDVTLPAVTLAGGDANQDDLVNVQDAVLVSHEFGQNAPPADARSDINGDGQVGIQDAVLVSRNFGAAAPIPWPTGAANRETARLEALARAALNLRAAGRGAATRAATTATLHFDPSPVFIPSGGSAGIDVRVEGAADLYGFEIHFTFDPSRLQVEGDLQLGALFAGHATQEYQNTVDNAAGRVDYAVSLQGAATGVSGNGTLVHLTLRGIADGSSSLVFTPATNLSDSQALLIPISLESGVVTVGAGSMATPTATLTPRPTATPPPGASGIYGQVTVLATPAPDILVGLFSYDGSDVAVVDAMMTDVDGRYQFTGAPALPAGYLYFTGFANVDADPQYLEVIIGHPIEGYQAGMTVHGGDLEIANLPLGEPDEERLGSPFPVLFRWDARNVANDLYFLHLFGADYIPDAGYTPDWVASEGTGVGSYRLSSQPGGFELGKQYFWDVYVFNGDTLGITLDTHHVIFSDQPAERPVYLPLVLRNTGSKTTRSTQRW